MGRGRSGVMGVTGGVAILPGTLAGCGVNGGRVSVGWGVPDPGSMMRLCGRCPSVTVLCYAATPGRLGTSSVRSRRDR